MRIEVSALPGSVYVSQGSQALRVLKGNVQATIVLGMDFVMVRLEFANVTKDTQAPTAHHLHVTLVAEVMERAATANVYAHHHSQVSLVKLRCAQ